jgi:hypothetical protein
VDLPSRASLPVGVYSIAMALAILLFENTDWGCVDWGEACMCTHTDAPIGP